MLYIPSVCMGVTTFQVGKFLFGLLYIPSVCMGVTTVR